MTCSTDTEPPMRWAARASSDLAKGVCVVGLGSGGVMGWGRATPRKRGGKRRERQRDAWVDTAARDTKRVSQHPSAVLGRPGMRCPRSA